MSTADSPAPRRDRRARGRRRRSRELALQALYQWLLTGTTRRMLCRRPRRTKDFARADKAHFEVAGARRDRACRRSARRHAAVPGSARRSSLSPIEHALLLIGAYELMHATDVPYRVAINEAVELAKSLRRHRRAQVRQRRAGQARRRRCGRPRKHETRAD